MLKKTPQDALEDESVAALSTICRALNWDLNVQNKDKSAIDAEIEIVHGVARTGVFLKCQLKAGKSYISSETDEVLRIRIESKYLQHWFNSNVQVALFYFEPVSQLIYWKDIRDYLRMHPNLLAGTQETRTIEFHKKLDLLTSETLPILEQVARGEFHYGFIELEEASTEIATSNRFPALPLPSVWTAPTILEHRSDITHRLQHQYSFTVNSGKLYSFADVRRSQCEIGSYCEKNKAVPTFYKDVPVAVLTELLNLSRDMTLLKRGLDTRNERFFFPQSVLDKPSTNKFSYSSLQGKNEERTLVYVQSLGGKAERKHHAVKLAFVADEGGTFLEIEPDWQFTFPRRISPLERKARLISEKASMHNKDFLYLLHFWKQFLSHNSDRIPFLISTNPIFGNIEFSAQALNFVLPFRMTNDYFGPKRNAE